MFQEIERDGKRIDRYTLLFVENAADDFMPELWTLNILDWSDMEIISSWPITASQVKWHYRRNPHIHLSFSRTTKDWGIAHSKVKAFNDEAMKTRLHRLASGVKPPTPPKLFLVQ